MTIEEKIRQFVSSEEDFDWLYNTDYLYIVKNHRPDDMGYQDVEIDSDHWDWRTKLRGPFEGPATVVSMTSNNMFEWQHGYIFGVSADKVIEFEKSALLSSIETGYRFQKISVILEKAQEKTQYSNIF